MVKGFGRHLEREPPNVHLIVLIFILSTISTTRGVDLSQCIAPLGMESGAIPDADITASSSFESGNVGPHQARMRSESHGGAWCPKDQITTEPREWLEIDLHTVHMITATGTQGRFGNGLGLEFTEAYLLEYWRPRLGKWVRYRDVKGQEVIKGNTNTYLESKSELEPPIWASKVRFMPYSYHRRTVCMRVELYGCYWSDGVVSYSMPQGDKRGNDWEFFDATYDGHWDGELRRGLGQLIDGRRGSDNFKMGYYDYDRGQGWVGWKNDSRNGQPIEIKFEFDNVREFSAVHIYCNNQFTKDVRVFSQVDILFSIGGKYYPGEPITYTYMEDNIFETPHNISVKLHHRVGKFVKLKLHFAAKWIMVSEVNFDSDVAHGNFTIEDLTSTETPVQSDVLIEKNKVSEGELPVSTAKHDDPTYMAVVIGVLTAVILLLAVAIFLIVSRHRQRKCFASPMTGRAPSHLGSTCATVEKGAALMAYTLEDDEKYAGGSLPTLPRDLGNRLLDIVKLDDYQEPYQALKYAPYYSYSTVVMEMKDMIIPSKGINSNTAVYANGAVDTSYDYAVPELGKVPLLNSDCSNGGRPLSSTGSEQDSIFSKTTRNSKTEDKKSPTQQEVLSALKKRLEQTSVPLFPRHRLRMLSKIADGAFGSVYVAEAEGIPEYGTTTTLGKRLVAVKFLLPEANEKEKLDFQRDIRILAALEDRNISRVLGACCREEPFCVVMEYLEHGDLCQFLKTHITAEDAHSMPLGVKTLSFNCLIYMAAQIASGMRYLENLNFVHRDLATRNCLVGKAYHVKISDFGTDNELYACDYYKMDGNVSLPLRWMAWESLSLGKYTTKSDVWSFAVTLWEILNLGRRVPYEHLTDDEVMQSLKQLHRSGSDSTEDNEKEDVLTLFDYLPRPTASSKDIYDLMLECWRREDFERPTFREISLFLQRKNLGYAPTS
ncbi:discoidin domain-containing receptor tyrosine kinase B-like [Leptopilina boulardi]|uniref:discoidin domain-containing receptor tyrosine kinase B-like n=1 Tax=Leptopilina boulardi TaxID=63433 RepID=UPI0021F5013D|nr:discoidin domain-containing receptor tyrosine kinase B-like [Leptopilina boulardi]XP_051161709.1 discoidin domain-containing receptor tyrosine kinase B-like [Leptopilina boulardi]XP_051161710.1 discoidin domain-containing receptor tyrosine kinase B-like [Leptopilina boulardi]